MTSDRALKRAGALLLCLALWQAAASRHSLLVASPMASAKKLCELAAASDFHRSILSSLSHIAGGFLLSLLCASGAAALGCRFEAVEILLEPLVAFMKSVPVAVVTILLLILLSSSGLTLAVVFLVVFPILYTALLTGVRAADPGLLEMARVFGWSAGRRWRYIRLSAAEAHLRSAFRVASGMAWKSGIAAEVIGTPEGSIGSALYSAKIYLATDELFAWAAVILLLGWLTERACLAGLRFLYRLLRSVRV